MAGVDEAFKKLESSGQNTVDNLIKWMQDSQVIEKTEAAEKKARDTFKESTDTVTVSLEKFKEVLGKLAANGSQTLEGLMGKLAGGLPALTDIAQQVGVNIK